MIFRNSRYVSLVEAVPAKADSFSSRGRQSSIASKHQMAGYYTIESVAHATVRKLMDVKGISEAKVLKLKDIVKQMVPMDFKTAADALEDRK
jgi:DNA repair protein RAD51